MKMTSEFDNFYDWAQRHLALDLDAYKQKQLQRRIYTIMKKSEATSLKTYSELLETDACIRQDFLDYITINVTDFFRNPDLFNEFEQVLLNELAPNFKKIKMWSAACSIGSEPYFLALLMRKHRLYSQGKILATDIDEKVLKRAQAGIYRKHELKNVDDNIRRKYFKQKGKDFIITPVIKNMVNFQKHNLLNDPFKKSYHAIICRNVIIYFKKEVKETLYHKFSDSLVTGGILFTGATEAIYKPEKYGLEKIGKFIYRKI